MFTKKKPLEIKKQTVTVASTKRSGTAASSSTNGGARPSSSSSNRLSSSAAPATSRTAPFSKSRPSALSTSSSGRGATVRGSAKERRSPTTRTAAPTSPPSATTVKRKRPPKPSAVPDFGDEEDDESENDEADAARELDAKRRKQREVKSMFKERQVRSLRAFEAAETGDGAVALQMVHAREIPRLDKSVRYEPYFPGLPRGYEIEVQYPSLCKRERYELVQAPNDNQAFDAIYEIAEVMHKTIEFYFPADKQEEYKNESTGLPQRLQRGAKKWSRSDIDTVLEEWNSMLLQLCKDGTIAKSLDEMLRPDPRLVEWIINQTHARTVSLNLKALHEYEAGTDNVYGELLPKFVSKILEDTLLGPDQVFVDLGSGVGNVVLQAALEAGCESWGCEMMEKYCDVADLQHAEFVARCQLWGLRSGAIQLERGDFLANARVHAALRRADVVLVNNQVFTPQTNDALTTLFLDLKDGCKVVSLKSFVPAGHRINVRNSQSPYSILGNIQQKEYFSKSVSWTDQGGKYFISTKDQNFLTKYNANGARG